MNMNVNDGTETPMSYYVSLASGALLAISELLPYLSKIEGNGIIQVVTNFLRKRQADEANLVAMQQRYDQILADVTRRLQALEDAASPATPANQ
jgi:hypothetical protein